METGDQPIDITTTTAGEHLARAREAEEAGDLGEAISFYNAALATDEAFAAPR